MASPPGSFTQVELQGVVTNLPGVTCWHNQVCFAVGQEEAGQGTHAGVVLSSTNGTDWSGTSVPAATGLLSVSCLSARHCVAVGGGGNNQGVVVATTNGSTWATVAVPAGTVSLNSISCSGSTCLAVGSVLEQNAYDTSVIGSSDGGATWSSRPKPQSSSEAYAVDCVDATHCWVVGSGAFVTHDGGSTWQVRDPPNGCQAGGTLCAPAYSVLDAVTFVSPLDGWVAGGDQCGGAHVTQCSGVIFRTTDGGSTWTQWNSYALAHYPFVDDIACPTDVSCTAVAQTFSRYGHFDDLRGRRLAGLAGIKGIRLLDRLPRPQSMRGGGRELGRLCLYCGDRVNSGHAARHTFRSGHDLQAIDYRFSACTDQQGVSPQSPHLGRCADHSRRHGARHVPGADVQPNSGRKPW